MSYPKVQQKTHQDSLRFMGREPRKMKSLLLVDDEQIIRNSLAKELASDTLKVTTVASGEEAIARINNDCFDLVITDLSMPGLDGFQVLKAAKKKSVQTMVIILTGYGSMESIIDALRLGVDDFLQKPCDTDELLYRVSNCFVKQDLLKKVSLYEKLLPVCCYCKKIRDDQHGEYGKGNWYSPDEYFQKANGIVRVSHGCCPDCYTEQLELFYGNSDE
jgi:YesN/AraC family two-component response regulator